MLHGLPLTYNKDLQEDKEHLFDAVDTIELCARGGPRDARRHRFDRDRLAAAAGDEMLAATDVADLLVRRGMPFREAHGVVAGLVRARARQRRRCRSCRDEELAAHAPRADGECCTSCSRERLAGVEGLRGRHRRSPRVREQLEQARAAACLG